MFWINLKAAYREYLRTNLRLSWIIWYDIIIFRFRSPLLTESRLIFIPNTKMFQFLGLYLYWVIGYIPAKPL